MAELDSWDITAANNNSAPPDGWPESTMQYSEVNNTAREGMAVMARYFQDINGTLQIAGAVNAYTLTLNAAYVAYFQGMYFAAEVNITNTGGATINVNSLGIKTIVDAAANILGPGDLQAGGIYEFRYDGTNFQLLGESAGGSIVSANIQVRTDIVTASPPVAEAVTGNYDVYDLDGTDRLASFGFNASNLLLIKNFMRGGTFQINATDAAGTSRAVFHGNPDGAAQIYHAGILTGRSALIVSGGLEVDQSVTASGFERVMTVSDNALKSNLAGPTFTGIPAAPTASVNTNTTQLATTAFVVAQIADDAPTKTGGGASGSWGISITGTASIASNVNVQDESTDTTCFPLFVTAASGNLPAKSGSNFAFNSSSGLLTVTSFAGNGASITAINAANISTGALAVLRGGTGATVVTGTGNNVLSASPTFSGTPFVPSININSTDSTISRLSAGNIEIEGRPIISHTDGALPSGRVHVSTSGPSGGANGDIWLERVA